MTSIEEKPLVCVKYVYSVSFKKRVYYKYIFKVHKLNKILD